MDDSQCVRVVQAGGDAAEIFQRRGRIERPVAKPVGEAPARDVLDDHVGHPVVLAEVVDIDDVGVAHLRDRLRFVAEPGRRVGIWGDPLQDLDRSGALQLDVVGPVDQAHGALADEVLDFVLP